MTFKAIRILSRSMTYNEIVSRYIKCTRKKCYKTQYLYLSMLWLKLFNIRTPDEKIRTWTYAIRAYKLYKKTP